MVLALIRYFIYGFVLFAGIWLIMDWPILAEDISPMVGYTSAVKWGAIGGISFLVAYGSGLCLKILLLGGGGGNAG
jgi:hypothetical protein